MNKHFCDICGKEMERPIDIRKVTVFPGTDVESKFELCLDCLSPRTIPKLIKELLFSEKDINKINFDRFTGKMSQEIVIDFGDLESLLKKHYGDSN